MGGPKDRMRGKNYFSILCFVRWPLRLAARRLPSPLKRRAGTFSLLPDRLVSFKAGAQDIDLVEESLAHLGGERVIAFDRQEQLI